MSAFQAQQEVPSWLEEMSESSHGAGGFMSVGGGYGSRDTRKGQVREMAFSVCSSLVLCVTSCCMSLITIRAWLETAPDIFPCWILGFKDYFTLANNTHANTYDETRPFFYYLVGPTNTHYLSLMTPDSSSITLLDQANQPCSTIQALIGYLSLTRPGCCSITSLHQ